MDLESIVGHCTVVEGSENSGKISGKDENGREQLLCRYVICESLSPDQVLNDSVPGYFQALEPCALASIEPRVKLIFTIPTDISW